MAKTGKKQKDNGDLESALRYNTPLVQQHAIASMFLDPYFSTDNDCIRISAEQASRFARQIADDFNPIHDPDSRRFCVPGDLLFALALTRYGLSERMQFRFRSMLGADQTLHFPDSAPAALSISDGSGRVIMDIERDGQTTHDPATIEAFIRCYVAFSGQNFPHLINPLLAKQGVMFNPDRPLIIYDSMEFTLQRLDFIAPEMELLSNTLEVDGKRGDVLMDFRLHAGKETIGRGGKKLLISGLRPYDDERMLAIVAEFNRRKQTMGKR